MIVRVIAIAVGATDDASGAAILGSRCLDGVFAIVASALPRQDALAIAERLVVLVIGIRPARADEIERMPRLTREL